MRGCNWKPLLLQLLLTHVITAVVFHNVLSDVAVHGPHLSLQVDKICECRAQCFVNPNCTAASYDKKTKDCNMTHYGRENVTLVPQNGVVALLKFELDDPSSTSLDTPSDPSDCPNDPPNGTVYVTDTQTKDASFQSQQKMCEREGDGVPFVIRTQAQREAAADAISGKDEKEALVTLTLTRPLLSLRSEITWPDGSLLSGCAFPDEFFSRNILQKIFVLTREGVMQSTIHWNFRVLSTPVLCLKFIP